MPTSTMAAFPGPFRATPMRPSVADLVACAMRNNMKLPLLPFANVYADKQRHTFWRAAAKPFFLSE